ncbi:SNF2 family N-terminal domain-containing protein [Xylariomycetidae sp. FL2044]|nr:SNF2 family N-terminal domain-containing protein [Xylariomycetidae sp. FL2044]
MAPGLRRSKRSIRSGLPDTPDISATANLGTDELATRKSGTHESATGNLSNSGSATSIRGITSAPAKRRGRPPKNTPLPSCESVSPEPTRMATISGSDYSTPATSNAVTPAPGVSSKVATDSSRNQLVVELPDLPQDSTRNSEHQVSDSNLRRSRRRATTQSYAEDIDWDEELLSEGEQAALKLQEEEYRDGDWLEGKKIGSPIPSSSTPPAQRTLGIWKPAITVSDSDDDLPIPVTNTKGKGRGKGKGKAVMPTRTQRPTTKRNIVVEDDEDDKDDDDPSRKRQKLIDENAARMKLIVDDWSNARVLPDPKNPDLDKSDRDHTYDDRHRWSPGILEDWLVVFPDSGPEFLSGPEAPRRRSEHWRRHLSKEERRELTARRRLVMQHPIIKTMWKTLEDEPVLKAGKAEQPTSITRTLKPFQLEGLAWMKAMEKKEWKGGLLGDEMGLGKTIQAVSLIMSDYPARSPSLVLVPPVALMQWTNEIDSYTDGKLKTLVFHGTNSKSKDITTKQLKQYDVIVMSYNSLESMYRRQEKGFKRHEDLYKSKSAIHQIKFHRIILDEAHCIKSRTSMTAKACFALQTEYRWCLTGTPLQNRIGEFFSLIRFLNIAPFATYLCRNCRCSSLEWNMDEDGKCSHCQHISMHHVSVFNQELLNPIQKFGNTGPGKEAFEKLRLLTDRIMLRRLKKDHTSSMELPVKEIYVNRQFFGEEENDLAKSVMNNGQREFDTYVAQGVVLNNYANIFGLIMQMRQVADHPDLLLKKSAEGGQNILVCCICDEPAEEAIRSSCKHDFCRACAISYTNSQDQPDCPQCHIPLSIDLEQPAKEQDAELVKKSSIINRIKMENWTSSSKIELLVHELHALRSDSATHKSIIFSQFTGMLQLIEWRLRRAGFTTVMLDGSMTPSQRQASINHFMKNVDVECFLVSLKAGGVALNLTEASRVFIVDPWWNPAAEWQSADRCHRIGQTRPCIITRLCIEDSVESRMVALQEKKTSMINSTINSDENAMESLTAEDLQFLFRGS